MRWVTASLVGAAHAWTFCAWAQPAQPPQPAWPSSNSWSSNHGPASPSAAYPVRPAPQQNSSQLIARTTGRAVADLYVDGRAICRLPCQVAVPSGMHLVGGRGAAGSSPEQRLYFAPGATVPVLLDVIPAGGVVRVTAALPGTLVYLDSVLVGNTN